MLSVSLAVFLTFMVLGIRHKRAITALHVRVDFRNAELRGYERLKTALCRDNELLYEKNLELVREIYYSLS